MSLNRTIRDPAIMRWFLEFNDIPFPAEVAELPEQYISELLAPEISDALNYNQPIRTLYDKLLTIAHDEAKSLDIVESTILAGRFQTSVLLYPPADCPALKLLAQVARERVQLFDYANYGNSYSWEENSFWDWVGTSESSPVSMMLFRLHSNLEVADYSTNTQGRWIKVMEPLMDIKTQVAAFEDKKILEGTTK